MSTPYHSVESVVEEKAKGTAVTRAGLTPEVVLQLSMQERNDLAALSVHAIDNASLKILLDAGADPLTFKEIAGVAIHGTETIAILIAAYQHDRVKLASFFTQVFIKNAKSFHNTPSFAETAPALLTATTTFAPSSKTLVYQSIYNLLKTLSRMRRQQQHIDASDKLLTSILSLPKQWLRQHLPAHERLIMLSIAYLEFRCIPHFPTPRPTAAPTNNTEPQLKSCEYHNADTNHIKLILENYPHIQTSHTHNLLSAISKQSPTPLELTMLSQNPPRRTKTDNFATCRDGRCTKSWIEIANLIADAHIRSRRDEVYAMLLVRHRGRRAGADEGLKGQVIVRCDADLFRVICDWVGWGSRKEDLLSMYGYQC
ncbi:hypothetical protein HK097_003139 [Rhizophlyctis rosea]|uniref:Uncharacterized protein n=1 Tax=Rhizophlyctis rosea TaxID=64517 RepID=A0AAD5SF44_9FUNG|nr:hypothetical protein HK097_003139 [Rhizophlyctis rosea]